jgi:hypothetical protein
MREVIILVFDLAVVILACYPDPKAYSTPKQDYLVSRTDPV